MKEMWKVVIMTMIATLNRRILAQMQRLRLKLLSLIVKQIFRFYPPGLERERERGQRLYGSRSMAGGRGREDSGSHARDYSSRYCP